MTNASLLLVALALVATGCGRDATSAPQPVDDPCPLITQQVLDRLAPDGVRVPSGDASNRSCSVDLSGSSPLRGDLLVEVSSSPAPGYDTTWRTARCREIGSQPSADGPGDTACLVVTPFDGAQSHVDGWAWVGTTYQAHVGYQLVEPPTLPATAEQDLRDLLAGAVASLPGR